MKKKIAFITGGTRGIGFGIASELAKSGFDIAVNGVRTDAEVQNAIQQLKDLGAEVIYCRGDVSSPDARNEMLEVIRKSYGKLHVLVNNAGIAPKERRDILEATEESFVHVVTTNLQGPYFLTQAVAN